MQDIPLEIRRFIINNFLFGQSRKDFTDDVQFLEAGIIDSTGVMELVRFLEEHFSIQVEDEDLVPANLGSVRSVSDYVSRKLEVKGAAA